MEIEKSAGAVVFRKEKGKIYYLILHYDLGHWGFPKGQIEKGEKPKETAKREIKEETGLEKIKFLAKFKEEIKYFYTFQGKRIFKIVIFFLAQTNQKKVRISWEHQGYQWLSFEKAKKMLSFKNSREVLKKANQFLKKNLSFKNG